MSMVGVGECGLGRCISAEIQIEFSSMVYGFWNLRVFRCGFQQISLVFVQGNWEQVEHIWVNNCMEGN